MSIHRRSGLILGRSSISSIFATSTPFMPLAVLVENVPDVLNHGGQNIAEEICEALEEKGYRLRAIRFLTPPSMACRRCASVCF